jgi:peptide/nickel transport system substrate-binding protein
LRWVGATDPRIFFENFHSGELSRSNRTAYQNPEMDRWLEAGQSTLDQNKRRDAYNQVQKIAAKDFPYINLWHSENTVAFRNNIKNVVLHPSGSWEPFLYLRKEN